MSYLLDTNVISETIKSRPSTNLINWLEQVPIDNLFISVLTVGEIRKGIEQLSNLKKKGELIVWLENDLRNWFGQRVLTIDSSVAEKWGFVCGSTSRSLSAIDALIAATALTHNLKLVTRNIKDFSEVQDLELINPF